MAKAAVRNTNCPQAAGPASAIQRGAFRRAPAKGRLACTAARPRARPSDSTPSSGIIGAAPLSACRRVWQVVLVVLGEHLVGMQRAGLVERAQRHDALVFAEQVRKNPLEAHGHLMRAIRNAELHGQAVWRSLHRAGLYQPAHADAGALR